MRGPDPDLSWSDEAYRHALVSLLLYGGDTPPDDDPVWTYYQNVFNPLPWHLPDTKEVEAIVAKHLPDAPKTDRPAIHAEAHRREPWFKRWFTNPEPTFSEFENRPDFTPSAEEVRPEFDPHGVVAKYNAEKEAGLYVTATEEVDNPMQEMLGSMARANAREREKGILDGIDLAIEHLEAHRITADNYDNFHSLVSREVGDNYLDILRRLKVKAAAMTTGDV